MIINVFFTNEADKNDVELLSNKHLSLHAIALHVFLMLGFISKVFLEIVSRTFKSMIAIRVPS